MNALCDYSNCKAYLQQELATRNTPQKAPAPKQMLERQKLKKVNVREYSSRLMKDSQGIIQPSYNSQIADDAKHPVIVAANLSRNAMTMPSPSLR